MKFGRVILSLFGTLAAHASASRLAGAAQAHPMVRLVTLMKDLEAKLEADGKAEQKAYDKYACWCEDTLNTKANDITAAKEEIEKLTTLVKELKGAMASHTVDIKQLKKDIAANVKSTQEATEIREKEGTEYQESREESEQCIGALEAAIKVLTGAGEGKKKRGFLETLQEAQLLSAIAGVRTVLKQPVVSRTVGGKELQMMRHFLDRPEDFVGGSNGMMSAMQTANNPFGDYAPKSTQIQGILKGMYDAFTGDLEKANAEEAEKQKGFEDLMKTKKAELAALEATLKKQEMDEAEKTKALAESKQSLDDTKTQLEDDEAFFDATKSSCQEKASQWALRVRLRTEELHGVSTAIKILSSEKAVKTFENATSSFLQLTAVSSGAGASGERAAFAYQRLRALATKYNSLQVGQLAAMIRTTGHFTKVIHAIEKMIAILKEEQQQDIKERDICEKKQLKNKQDMEDLNFDIEKADDKIKILKNKAGELEEKIKSLEKDIEETEKEIKELVGVRTKEQTAYLKSVQDDLEAIQLIEKAIVAISRFYKSNKLPMSLAQSNEEHVKPGKPELGWKDGNYGGRTGESGGIIAILTMIKEDFENEIEEGQTQDSGSSMNFLKDKELLESGLENSKDSLVSTKRDLADTNAKIADTEEHKGQKEKDLDVQNEIKETLKKNCAWVETHFDKREEARNAEIAGLIEAKHYLHGMQ